MPRADRVRGAVDEAEQVARVEVAEARAPRRRPSTASPSCSSSRRSNSKQRSGAVGADVEEQVAGRRRRRVPAGGDGDEAPAARTGGWPGPAGPTRRTRCRRRTRGSPHVAEPDGLGEVVERREDVARRGEVVGVGADRDDEEHGELRERGIDLLGVDRDAAVRLLHAPAPSRRRHPLAVRRDGIGRRAGNPHGRMVDREQPHPRQEPRRASRRPRHRVRMGRDRARPEEGAVRRAARRVGRRAAREPARLARSTRTPTPRHPLAWHDRDDLRASRTARFITVTGELKHDERVKLGGIEVKIGSLEVVAEAIPETPDRRRLQPRQAHGLALPRPAPPEAEPDLPHPDHVPARAAHLLGRATTSSRSTPRSSWHRRRESRAELFEVGYFEGTAYLAQSPQFFKQMAQPAGFGKVFEVGPAFRADPSFTSRHATEFTSIDAEISWIDSHEDVMQMHEELLVAGLTAVKAKHGAEIEALFGIELEVPTTPFPRIPLAEAKQIVAERGYVIPRARRRHGPRGRAPDLRVRARRPTATTSCSSPTAPSSIRPFYHMRHDGRPDPHEQLRPHLQRRRDLHRRAARAPHRRARRAGEGEGPRPRGARVLPRLLPLRRAAARRLRHGPRPRA